MTRPLQSRSAFLAFDLTARVTDRECRSRSLSVTLQCQSALQPPAPKKLPGQSATRTKIVTALCIVKVHRNHRYRRFARLERHAHFCHGALNCRSVPCDYRHRHFAAKVCQGRVTSAIYHVALHCQSAPANVSGGDLWEQSATSTRAASLCWVQEKNTTTMPMTVCQ